MEPTKIPCLSQGIMAGFWVDLEFAWAGARGSQAAVTCKRSWASSGSNRGDFMVGCPLTSAAVYSCMTDLGRCFHPVPQCGLKTLCVDVTSKNRARDDTLPFPKLEQALCQRQRRR